ERAARTAARIASLPEEGERNIVATETTSREHTGAIITVNGQFILVLLTEDLDRESSETLKAAADQATSRLRIALDARARQRHWPDLLKAIGWVIAATIVALLGLWLLGLGGRRLHELMVRRASAHTQRIKLGGIDPAPLLRSLVRGIVRLLIWSAAIALVYVWLTFVMLSFPYTQPWGQQLGTFLLTLFGRLGLGLVHATPGLFTVLVIFLFTRIVARVVSAIFRRVEKSDLKLRSFDPDTARATRRLVTVLIWLFGLAVAYPFIPGSHTDAFKGISVFAGLVLSLGS